MRLIKQSQTAQPLCFLMVLASDHITGATGLSPTVTLAKSGGSFASPSGAVSEMGNGWYKVAGNATDSATLGPLILHASAATADPSDVEFEIIAPDVQSANAFITGINSLSPPTNWNLLSIDGSGLVNITQAAADKAWGTAARILTAGTNIVLPSNGLSSVTAWTVAITGNITGNLSGSVGSVTGLTASNLDTTVSSRMATYTQPTGFLAANFTTGIPVSGTVTLASSQTFNNTGTWTGNLSGSVGSVTGFTPSDVTAIKTKTDFLPSATAGAAGGVFIAGTNASLTVTGNVTVGGGLSIATTVAIGSTLTVVGTTTFGGAINITGNLHCVSNFNIDGVMNIGGVSNISQTGDSYVRIGATGSGLTSLAPSSTALSTDVWTPTIAGRIDVTLSTLATASAQIAAQTALTKIQSATYDSVTLIGDTLTLSNGHTMVVSSTGRVTT